MLAASLAACEVSPVEWGPIAFSGGPGEPTDIPSVLQTSPPGALCPASLRVATTGGVSYAAWFQSRPDSSVTLFMSRAVSGGGWLPAAIVDSTDHGVRGCARPAPGISADSASGYVHIAWFAEPGSGGGVFFAHSMDQGITFHAPVPIVYGRNPSGVSVAASGDRVAVAYEDPNAVQPIVAIALSKTMGHIFENRLQGSSDNGRARQPVVRLDGDSVRLWWSEYSENPSISATRRMYRAGKWK